MTRDKHAIEGGTAFVEDVRDAVDDDDDEGDSDDE
jgi:hypothetical protein